MPAARPDRSHPTPLWAQVAADLRRRCLAGEFVDGVPGEHALVDQYEVSRHTVREALRVLRAEGLIASHPGRSSVVQPRFSQSLGAVYSLFRSVEEQGAVQSSDVLRQQAVRDPAVAARLGVAPDALLVTIERVRRANGDALAHDQSWLPHSLAHPLLETDLTRTALYDELGRFGVLVDGGTERMTATVADAPTARLLGCRRGHPLLQIERLASADGRPVEWRSTQVRGDRFAVETHWTPAGLTVSGRSEKESA